MSNPEVECLVRDAKELMCHIVRQDQDLEDVIRRASAVRAKIDCMKEYQDIVDSFNNATSNGKTRAILLRDLHKETRLIQKYVKENLELKEINYELLAGLNSIMNRHRLLMEQMTRPENKINQMLLPQLFEKNQAAKEKKYHNHERNMYYYRKLTSCLSRCEQDTIENAEIMASLREENAGLRELLNIHKINEPAVFNVYNKARKAFADRQAKEREEMHETVIERSFDEKSIKKISVIESKPVALKNESSVNAEQSHEEEDDYGDMSNTIMRKPSD